MDTTETNIVRLFKDAPDRVPEETLSDGEMLDRFGDMLSPAEIVAILDRKLWPHQVAGVCAILITREAGEIDDDISF